MATPESELDTRWFLNRIRNVINHEGVSGFVFRTAAFLGYKCGIWVVGWYVKSLDVTDGSVKSDLIVDITELSQDDQGSYIACNRVMTAEAYRQRITKGDRCFAAWYDNKIVSASWIAIDNVWIDFIARDVPLRKGEIYIYESFTHPSFRGKHIQRELFEMIVNRYKSVGYEQICVIIAPENRSNIKSRQSSGFKRDSWILGIKMRWWHWDSFRH